jgi:hypothetical protein
MSERSSGGFIASLSSQTPSQRGDDVWAQVIVSAAVVVLLSACSGGGDVIQAGDVSVLVSERTGGGMDALGGGRLEVVGGCLGASGSVIVWPHGTKVLDEDPLTIEIPEYGTFTVGDDVQVGGGYVLEHSSTKVGAGPYDVAGISVPAECAAHDIFLAAPDG